MDQSLLNLVNQPLTVLIINSAPSGRGSWQDAACWEQVACSALLLCKCRATTRRAGRYVVTRVRVGVSSRQPPPSRTSSQVPT